MNRTPAKNIKKSLARNSKTKALETSWFSKIWNWSFLAGTIFGSLLGFFITTITQIPEVLRSLRVIPAEFIETKDQFNTWYHEDQAWGGLWTSYPEGYVDIEDLDLSETDTKLAMQAKHGLIDGVISTSGICKNVTIGIDKTKTDPKTSSRVRKPVKELSASKHYAMHYFLITGKINGANTADIIVFDIIGGRKQEFAHLKAKRSGVILELAPVNKDNIVLQETVRLGQHPDIPEDKAIDALSHYCYDLEGDMDRKYDGGKTSQITN